MIIVDTVQAMDSNRIPIEEYKELVIAYNVNLEFSDEAETWFDIMSDNGLTELSDEEFFNTFISFDMAEA